MENPAPCGPRSAPSLLPLSIGLSPVFRYAVVLLHRQKKKKKSSRVQGHVPIQACSCEAKPSPSCAGGIPLPTAYIQRGLREGMDGGRSRMLPVAQRRRAQLGAGASGTWVWIGNGSGMRPEGGFWGRQKAFWGGLGSPAIPLHLTFAAPAASLREFNFQRDEGRGKEGTK